MAANTPFRAPKAAVVGMIFNSDPYLSRHCRSSSLLPLMLGSVFTTVGSEAGPSATVYAATVNE